MNSISEGTIVRDARLADFDRVADIINSHADERVTGDLLRERFNRWDPKDPRLVLVAERDGDVIAHAYGRHRYGEPEGKFMVMTYIDKRHEHRGLGLELAKTTERFARENGGKYLLTFAEEIDERSNRFVARYGFRRTQTLFESKLQLAESDVAPSLARRQELEAAGYRILTLTELGFSEENKRRIHAADTEADRDTPGVEDWGHRTYEQYCRDEFESFGFDPDGVLIAEHDDEIAAVHSLRRTTKEGIWQIDFTGVQKHHRGKGLAVFLKVLGQEFAKSQGAVSIRTNNDTRNQPMLAVNAKLGYKAQPGFHMYRLDLE